MRILAVDDDELILDLLRTVLGDTGFGVLTCATSAEQALELIDQADHEFDCFLLDIMMPGRDGIELCADIRRMAAYRRTPIIMITALTGHQHMERAFVAGATDYVNKPLNGLELGTRINIAGMLNQSLRREKENAALLADFMRDARTETADRIQIRGIDGVIDYLALENHLLRLPDGCFAMSVLAFELAGPQDLRANATEAEFVSIVRTAARAIADTLEGHNFLISYAGDGQFVGLCSGRHVVLHNVLQGRANELLAGSANPAVERLAPKLVVQAPSNQRLMTGRNALSVLSGYLRTRQLRQRKLAPPDDESARLFEAINYEISIKDN